MNILKTITIFQRSNVYVCSVAVTEDIICFAKLIYEEFQQNAILCGLYDINPVRTRIVSEYCGNAPTFDNFKTMLHSAKPDYIIVATIDTKRHEYIVRVMEAGFDVIFEKPMTIDDY